MWSVVRSSTQHARLSKLTTVPSGERGSAFRHHEFDIKTQDTFPLAPLGERGDRKAGGEGVRSKMGIVCLSRKSKS
jgi:hypothetical protein